MLHGFDQLAAEEEEEEFEFGEARLLPPPPSKPPVSNLSLWLVFFILCFSTATFFVDWFNTSCWTARDELMLLKSLQLEQQGWGGKWPLAAAHSEHDDLQAQPLQRARSLGFCSFGVSVELESRELRLAGGKLLNAYLLALNRTGALPHAQGLGVCQRPVLSMDFLDNRIKSFLGLETLLSRDYWNVGVLVEVDSSDTELLERMVNTPDRKSLVDLYFNGTSSSVGQMDSRWWPLVGRFTVDAEWLVGGGEGSGELVQLARGLGCPVRVANTQAGNSAAWTSLLNAGANLLSTFDIAELETFLRS